MPLLYGFAGFVVGMFVMALCCAAGRADRHSDWCERNAFEGDHQADRLRDLAEKARPN